MDKLADASLAHTVGDADAREYYVGLVGTAQLVYGLDLADATCEYDHDVIAADHDLIVVLLTPAQQAAGYWILATDSYADTLEALAAGSDAPWADNRAALARAEADRVAVVAPQNQQREISAAEAAQIQRVAEVDAEKAKVIGKAQAGKTLADAGAQAAYAQALARANAIDADENFGPRPFGMTREVTHFVAIEGSLAVTSDLG